MMANVCIYSMTIKGELQDIKEFRKIMEYKHPDKLCFSRVFEDSIYDEKHPKTKDNKYIDTFYGECAWSVYTCMLDGENTYYNKNKDNKNTNYKITNVLLESKRLNLEIEIYSEEYGYNFEEYFYIKNGELIEHAEEDVDRKWDENKGDFIITGGLQEKASRIKY